MGSGFPRRQRDQERVTVVGKQQQKNKILDDIAARLRGVLEDLDRLLSPQPPARPARVPVPVPVQRPKRDYYR